MKKIFLLSCLLIALYPFIVQSATGDEANPKKWSVIETYCKQHILPVVKEKRLAFDRLLNSSERSELDDYRTQMHLLHDKFRRHFHENSEALPEQKASMLTDESRKERRLQMKELMSRVHEMADRHEDELDRVFSDLQPQLQQWIEDISGLLPAEEGKAFSFLRNMSEEHRGPFRIMGRAAFLLLDPSTTISADDKNKVAASELLPASLEESMSLFPNPAVSSVTLNLPNIPADNQLTITDMEGKTMLEKEHLSSLESIDCSGFPAGMYFVRLRTGDDVANRKLVISH
jgi:hypothetical protein